MNLVVRLELAVVVTLTMDRLGTGLAIMVIYVVASCRVAKCHGEGHVLGTSRVRAHIRMAWAVMSRDARI